MTAQAEKAFFVSITASQPRVVLYVGMTSDLAQRAWQHRERDSGELASRRECAMKRRRRDWKIALIEQPNPTWADLYAQVLSENGFDP